MSEQTIEQTIEQTNGQSVAQAEQTATPTTFSLSRAAMALHHLAASDESRPLLANIWSKDGVMIGADGFVAGSVRPAGGVELPDRLTIPGKVAETAKRRTTRLKRGVELTVNGRSGELQTEAKPHDRLAFDMLDDTTTWLDLEKIKKTDAPRDTYVLSASLLKKIATYLDEATTDDRDTSKMVEVRSWGPNQAVEFRALSPDGEVLGIIMPMICGDRNWFFDPIEGVNREGLPKHHLAQAIRDGAAGYAASVAQAALDERAKQRPASAAPDDDGWTEVHIDSLEQAKQLVADERRATAAHALDILGYDEAAINAALAALDAASIAEQPVATAAD